MSYAIIRNEKYTKEQMIQIAPHNERFKKKYSNKNIDLSRTSQNYHLKKPIENGYLKEYKRLIDVNNLSQGQLHSNSIYACEVIVTSDSSFFGKLGEKERKRYFEESYNFMANYKNLGEENIISAVIHLDEETPHMHLVYIPVVKAKDKNGKMINKISASEFWKGKESYKKLQDNFYKYIKEKRFEVDRRNEDTGRQHINIEDMKKLTNFYDTKILKENIEKTKDERIQYSDIQEFYKYENFTKDNVNKKLIIPLVKYNNKLAMQNDKLMIELSKVKKAREYYYELEKKFIELQKLNKESTKKIDYNKIELEACYDVIKELNEKNEKMEKTLTERFGISIQEY
ncbi:MAG: plasmid recombination protein [Clostridia bacterium]|nr:plasmid recombination protein [Clostridia bacterium]